MYAAYGKKIGGGILMYGPPGCGKTHLARATAGKCKPSSCRSVSTMCSICGSAIAKETCTRYLIKLVAVAPAFCFFDEVDALGASRSDMRQSAGRHLVNQFLSEMDGVDSNNEGVLILGATNAPWHIDSAFRRPGRFDQVIFVPPPDLEARGEILRILLEGKPIQDVDCQQVAAKLTIFLGRI